jgi:hypothetical protein
MIYGGGWNHFDFKPNFADRIFQYFPELGARRNAKNDFASFGRFLSLLPLGFRLSGKDEGVGQPNKKTTLSANARRIRVLHQSLVDFILPWSRPSFSESQTQD